MRCSCAVSASSSLSFGGPVAHAFQHLGGHRGVEGRLSGGHPAHRVHEVVAPHLLEDVAGGAGHDRGEQRVVVVVRREDERLDRGVDGADVAAHVDAGAVGQPAVEDRDMRTQRWDAPGRLLGGAGLAHDDDVSLALEELPDAAAHELVVVEQEDPDRRGRGIVRGRGLGSVVGHLPKVVALRDVGPGRIGPDPRDQRPCLLWPLSITLISYVSTALGRRHRDQDQGCAAAAAEPCRGAVHRATGSATGPAPDRRARHPRTERAQHPTLAVAGRPPFARAVRRPVPSAARERPGRPQPRDQLWRSAAPCAGGR